MSTFRKAVENISCIVKKILIVFIKLYRNFISPFLGSNCRFYPSCSLYTQIAIERFGIYYGLWLSLKRILKCNPWYKNSGDDYDGYDPVPEKKKL